MCLCDYRLLYVTFLMRESFNFHSVILYDFNFPLVVLWVTCVIFMCVLDLCSSTGVVGVDGALVNIYVLVGVILCDP